MILTDYVACVYEELENLSRSFCFDLSATDQLYVLNIPIDIAVSSLLDEFGNREAQDAFEVATDEGVFDNEQIAQLGAEPYTA